MRGLREHFYSADVGKKKKKKKRDGMARLYILDGERKGMDDEKKKKKKDIIEAYAKKEGNGRKKP